MFEAIFKSLEDTFVQLNLRRFVFWIFFLIMMCVALCIFEFYTGYGFQHRMDQYLDELDKLHKLEQAGVENSEELKPLYEKGVSELARSHLSINVPQFNTHLLIRVLSSNWIWLIMVFVGIKQRLGGDKSGTSLIIGAGVFSVTIGVIAALVQPPFAWWISCLLFFGIQILVTLLLVWWGNRKKR